MKICLCFIGLQRTISRTYQNIEINIIDTTNEFTKVFVTWKNENIDIFLSLYPDTIIHRVDEVSQEDEEFKKWKDGLQMHISWRRTYEPDFALFRYYQQIYLWKKASEFLVSYKNEFDLFMRLRSDSIFLNNPIHEYYNIMLESELSIFFPSEPRQSILKEGEGCPDQFFIGKPESVLKALQIIDFLHKYKITYIEKHIMLYPVDTLEENIIQPESSLYYYLKGEGVDIKYLPTVINILR